MRAAGLLLPLGLAGALGALAFAVENAHQSWGALFLTDVVGAGAGTAAWAPAVFAGVVAFTRFAVGAASDPPAGVVLVVGGSVAAAGTALVAAATTVPIALIGLAAAAAGTAVLFPTLLVAATAQIPDRLNGTVTSAITTLAYLGFLAGPVYVGWWSQARGLPAAMAAVAALPAVFVLAAVPATRVIARRSAQRGTESQAEPEGDSRGTGTYGKLTECSP
ncbi:MAG: hypothetical protein ACR2JK_16610 [Geodermatophilaceae bacterium]